MQQKRISSFVLLGLLPGVLICGALAMASLPTAGQRDVWRIGELVSYENLSVFPIFSRAGSDTSGFVTLEEALASGDAVVTERGGEILRRSPDGRPMPMPQAQSASVNQLVLIHRGKKPLVLLAGEVVTGGKQDRVIAKDRIVAPGSDPLPLDVFCVERGRWSGASAQFSGAGLFVHPSVREKAAVEQKQDEVWAAVRSGTTARAEAASAPAAAPALSARDLSTVIASEAQSESYGRIYKGSRVGQSVEAFAAEVERRFARIAREKGEQLIGVIVAYGSEVAWADVFASQAMFDRYWPKLLRSYVVEALARPRFKERAALGDAREFLAPLQGRETTESEPGVYRWRQIAEGKYAEIALEALPKGVTLHWVKILRTS
jgi:hypothetical protein